MAAILPSSYKEGTATVANGSTAVTGINTFWGTPNGEGNPILPGDWFGVHKGYAIRIASIEGNGALTLANPWPGPSQTDAAYEVMLQSDNARMATSTRQLLQQLMNGNITAFSGLTGQPNTVPYFTGPGAMGLLTRQDLTQGVNYDVQVDALADRAAYDLQVPGYAVLVSDVGDGRAAIYSKVTASSGDWSDPAYITGPRGLNWKGVWSGATAYEKDDAVSYNNASWIALVDNTNVAPVAGATWGLLAARGATGATGVNPRGAYDNATAYAVTDSVLHNGSTWIAIAATTGNAPPNLPTTSNTWWQLLAQKGTDGTGIGDVVGPAGGVATDDFAAFNSSTGKLIKKLTDVQVNDRIGMEYLKGGELSRSSATVIGIAVLEGKKSGVFVKTSAAFTKQINAAWVKGTGNGGLDTGSIAANSSYHAHAIRQTSTGDTDVLISGSATAPNLPSGWVLSQRLGALRTNASSQIIDFTQVGNRTIWATSVLDFASTATRTLAPIAISVPLGVRVQALFQVKPIAASSLVAVVNVGYQEFYSTTTATYTALESGYDTDVAGSIPLGCIGSPHATLQWEFRTRGWVDVTIPRIGG